MDDGRASLLLDGLDDLGLEHPAESIEALEALVGSGKPVFLQQRRPRVPSIAGHQLAVPSCPSYFDLYRALASIEPRIPMPFMHRPPPAKGHMAGRGDGMLAQRWCSVCACRLSQDPSRTGEHRASTPTCIDARILAAPIPHGGAHTVCVGVGLQASCCSPPASHCLAPTCAHTRSPLADLAGAASGTTALLRCTALASASKCRCLLIDTTAVSVLRSSVSFLVLCMLPCLLQRARQSGVHGAVLHPRQ